MDQVLTLIGCRKGLRRVERKNEEYQKWVKNIKIASLVKQIMEKRELITIFDTNGEFEEEDDEDIVSGGEGTSMRRPRISFLKPTQSIERCIVLK